MTKYLIDDQPLIVLPKLAKKVGLNESLFLQQLHYWLLQKRNAREGYYWAYNSYPEWLKQFPFWSESTLKRTVTNLENMGLVVSGNYNSMKIDKTKWYRIDYEIFKEITKDIEEFTGKVSNDESCQNEPTNVSNRTDEDSNLNRPIPEITTKNTTKIKNIPPTKSKAKYDESSPYYQMAQYLYNKILDNNPNAKQPNYQKWSNDFRLIVERDKRDTKQLKEIIDFTQTDSFWKTAVFSPSSIRDKYDRFVVIISEKGKNKYNGNKEYQKQDAMSLMLDKFENGGFGNEPTNERRSNGLFIPEDVGTL